MRVLTTIIILAALLLSAAVFGFFYAWVCSTMWGLDAADPRVAIAAMQAMNASVRNAVFFPAFFLTPFALALAGGMVHARGARASAALFGLAALVYLCFGLVLTMVVNVPMNEALASVAVPADIEAARAIWQDYSAPWQAWNQARAAASGIAFLLAAWATLRLGGAGRSAAR